VFFQAEDGIRDFHVTGLQTCALPISRTSTGASACSAVVAVRVAVTTTWSRSVACGAGPGAARAAGVATVAMSPAATEAARVERVDGMGVLLAQPCRPRQRAALVHGSRAGERGRTDTAARRDRRRHALRIATSQLRGRSPDLQASRCDLAAAPSHARGTVAVSRGLACACRQPAYRCG